MTRIALFLLFLAPLLPAQLRENLAWASPVYRDGSGKVDKWLTAGLTGIYLSSAADAGFTRSALGDGAVEHNPILRPLYARAPGAAETAKFGLNALQVWMLKKSMRSCRDDKMCKGLVHVMAWGTTAVFSYAAYHNYGVSVECRRGGCR